MINLRPYQNESIIQLRHGFANKYQRQVLCLPTGAGKTVVFSEMVRMAAERGTVTIVLTDRTELFKQTVKSLSRIGVAVEEISPNKKNTFLGATIYLAMVETIKRRSDVINLLRPQLIIADEAHKGNFTRILDLFPDARVIGATATPEGKHFFKYYQNIVQNVDIPDLIEQGFLVDYMAYQMEDDFSDLEVKAGEFTDASNFSHFDKPTLYDGVIKEWNRLAKGLKTICFNVNIAHTINTHNAFLQAGISSEYITSKTTKEERERILNAFKNGAFTVLNNCGILTTGYDEPTIQCVIMNRATKSLPLFLQCFGRGSRILEGVIDGLKTDEERLSSISLSDKPSFIGLDFGMNHNRHGMWNEAREWKLKKPKEKKESITPVKECKNEECGCLNPVSARICKYCGTPFPLKEKSLLEGIMVEVSPRAPDEIIGRKISSLSISELLLLEASKKYKSSFIWRVVRSHGEEAIKEYADIKGYKSGWLKRQIQELDNCEYTDYKIK